MTQSNNNGQRGDKPDVVDINGIVVSALSNKLTTMQVGVGSNDQPSLDPDNDTSPNVSTLDKLTAGVASSQQEMLLTPPLSIKNDERGGSLSSSGRRSIVTSMRLQRQGFVGRNRSVDFAMKSIRRGSSEWHNTLRPFVADIAFESFVQRRYQSATISFRPYTCHAAVLFVDLSDYSMITAAIAHRGAHALSSIVNAYLSRLLVIVREYGGDVIKFAGDAVLVVWYGASEDDLQINTLTAAKCGMEMQKRAGQHAVDGTSLQFRIHCGLSCGPLESEIFDAPNHVNMQRLFHSVGGTSLIELSDLVDMAKAGEICLSDDAVAHIGATYGRYEECSNLTDGTRYQLLTDLVFEHNIVEKIETHIMKSTCDRNMKRQKSMEEDFIHPNVIKLLSHGGLSPTHISQMRNLCVLFIAMTSSIGSSVNWLMEVQTILDKHRCPSKLNFWFLVTNLTNVFYFFDKTSTNSSQSCSVFLLLQLFKLLTMTKVYILLLQLIFRNLFQNVVY
jgi:class 3 adenylate cyclase